MNKDSFESCDFEAYTESYLIKSLAYLVHEGRKVAL